MPSRCPITNILPSSSITFSCVALTSILGNSNTTLFGYILIIAVASLMKKGRNLSILIYGTYFVFSSFFVRATTKTQKKLISDCVSILFQTSIKEILV